MTLKDLELISSTAKPTISSEDTLLPLAGGAGGKRKAGEGAASNGSPMSNGKKQAAASIFEASGIAYPDVATTFTS